MPFSDIGPDAHAMDEFSAHCDDVNTHLGRTSATELTLQWVVLRVARSKTLRLNASGVRAINTVPPLVPTPLALGRNMEMSQSWP